MPVLNNRDYMFYTWFPHVGQVPLETQNMQWSWTIHIVGEHWAKGTILSPLVTEAYTILLALEINKKRSALRTVVRKQNLLSTKSPKTSPVVGFSTSTIPSTGPYSSLAGVPTIIDHQKYWLNFTSFSINSVDFLGSHDLPRVHDGDNITFSFAGNMSSSQAISVRLHPMPMTGSSDSVFLGGKPTAAHLLGIMLMHYGKL